MLRCCPADDDSDGDDGESRPARKRRLAERAVEGDPEDEEVGEWEW